MTATQREGPAQQSSQSARAITEDQARTMWCPYAMTSLLRSTGGGVYGIAMHNRNHEDGTPVQGCLCLASGCMGWIADIPAGYGYCGMAQA